VQSVLRFQKAQYPYLKEENLVINAVGAFIKLGARIYSFLQQKAIKYQNEKKDECLPERTEWMFPGSAGRRLPEAGPPLPSRSGPGCAEKAPLGQCCCQGKDLACFAARRLSMLCEVPKLSTNAHPPQILHFPLMDGGIYLDLI